MKWIDYTRPHSLEEAVCLLEEAGGGARMLAGGTDLLVQLRIGRRQPDLVVDGKEIPELNEISYDSKLGLTLGAAVPCYKVYGDTAISAAYPGLIDSASIIGGIQIQGRASIGGNLCNAAPSADAIPILIALGATCTIASSKGSRQVAVEDFCTGPGATIMQSGEIMVSLHIPPPVPNQGAHYRRFIPRNEMDIAVAGVGSLIEVDASSGQITKARIALASVAPTPVRAYAAEE